MTKSEVEARAKFDLIRYAQCWEDADILVKALDIKDGDTCLSIASAGDNSLALLTKNPGKVIAIDLSMTQLYCLELRVAAYRHLDHSELLEFMGSRPSQRRKVLFQKCLPSLQSETLRFWQSKISEVEKYGIAGVGKFENYFRLFRTYALPLICSKSSIEKLFSLQTQEEKNAFYTETWNTWRWRFILNLFFSKFMVGRLGRDPAFFEYVDGSLPEHVGKRLKHALCELTPSENPYLQWIFTGEHPKALPLALRKENFEIIRSNLDRLEWRYQSIEAFLETGETVHAFNLSNIFEYMSEDAFETIHAGLLESAESGARFAYWNMMVPRSLPESLKNVLKPCSDLARALYKKDKAFFYSNFVVEEKI